MLDSQFDHIENEGLSGWRVPPPPLYVIQENMPLNADSNPLAVSKYSIVKEQMKLKFYNFSPNSLS